MVKAGQAALTMRKDTYERFIEARDRVRKLNPKVTTDIFISMLLDTFEEAKRVLPPIQLIGFEANEIHLYDRLKEKLIVIRIKDSELVCEFCESKECLHIGYAYSLDEVRGLIISGIIKKSDIIKKLFG